MYSQTCCLTMSHSYFMCKPHVTHKVLDHHVENYMNAYVFGAAPIESNKCMSLYCVSYNLLHHETPSCASRHQHSYKVS